MKTIDEALEKLDAHEAEVYEIIIAEVIKLARFVLNNNRGLKEFIMAMGMFCITRRKVDWRHDYSEDYEFAKLKGGKELFDMIVTHNERFKITGDPIRFTATGKIVTDW